MILIRHIISVSLAILILVGTVGIQIIKDVCVPCHEATVLVQLPHTEYETKCEHGCHAEESSCPATKVIETESCDEHHSGKTCSHAVELQQTLCCNDLAHSHKTEHVFLNELPDFYKSQSIENLKLTPLFVSVFQNVFNLDFVQNEHSYPTFLAVSFEPPEKDVQSILCTYLI